MSLRGAIATLASTLAATVAVTLAAVLPLVLAADTAHAAGPTLTDDTGGTSLFGAGLPWSPGVSRVSCVTVTVDGAVAGDQVRFAVHDVSGALAPGFTLALEQGTGGHFGDCTGFSGTTALSGTFPALEAVLNGTALAWDPAGTPSVTFRLTVTLDPATHLMGASASASFTWTLMSTASGAVPAATPPPPASATIPTTAPATAPTSTSSSAVTGAVTTTATTAISPSSEAQPTSEPTGGQPVGPGGQGEYPPAVTGASPAGSAPESSNPGSSDPVATADPWPDGSPQPGPFTDGVPQASLTIPLSGPRRPGDPGDTAAGVGRVRGGGDPGVGAALRQGLSAMMRSVFGARTPQVLQTVSLVSSHPGAGLSPALVALLFLSAQNVVDRRDPRLALAARTRREQLLTFPRCYQRTDDDEALASLWCPPVPASLHALRTGTAGARG